MIQDWWRSWRDKNVIAIAAGCAVGAGYGDNAKAAIITRALRKLFVLWFFGGRPKPFSVLPGSEMSHVCRPTFAHMAFGLALRRGDKPSLALAEGAYSWPLSATCSAPKNDLPPTSAVDKLVNHGQDLHEIVVDLLARRAGINKPHLQATTTQTKEIKHELLADEIGTINMVVAKPA